LYKSPLGGPGKHFGGDQSCTATALFRAAMKLAVCCYEVRAEGGKGAAAPGMLCRQASEEWYYEK